MKLKNSKNKTKESSNKQINKVENLINYGILLITIIGVLIIIIGNCYNSKDISENNIKKEYEALSKAYSDTEGIYLSIELEEITTSKEIYEKIKEKCNEYISKDNSNLDKIQTELEIHEDEVYIDKIENNKSEINSIFNNEVKTLELTNNNETGPIYFQDKMILRYINEYGAFKIIASNEPEVYSKSELNKLFDKYTDYKEKSKTGILYEKQYVQEVVDIFKDIINSGTNNLDKNTKKKAVRYLTYDGYKYIVINNIYKLDKLNNPKVTIAEIGKSSLKKDKKDRIYLRIEADNEKTIDIILKLNDNYKIFDIDMI